MIRERKRRRNPLKERELKKIAKENMESMYNIDGSETKLMKDIRRIMR